MARFVNPRIEFITPDRTIRHEKRKRVPATTGHGFTSVADGHEVVTYRISLHTGELEQMALKAAHNKSGKSKDGPLTIEIIARRPA